ncbi:RNA polymerase sigma factor [Amycolatopsis sp. 195334CR]|uniref:RNA polymerase sigma factor n=1 Tax=Amycolatopsis sp. 195334CR TaxID=2814588 RepID=UPI001A8CC1C3|nr:sigma-70 family RNA polymerase sigma factor [Amycolatopsis sp. 195334CR]MBN6038903.1 sigma-70 family RNA polymerase sigma factor [Amycolatopsis sp. 195334CR]
MTEPVQLTDAALLDAVRAGDLPAYGLLFERHAEAARQFARRWHRSPAERHELVAEGFARVLAAIRGGAGPREHLRPYLLVTMRHLAITWQRRLARVELYGEVPESGADPTAPRLDEVVLHRWNAQLAGSAFQRLPERWQLVLWHTEVESASAADLASALGISPNGVAALAKRAREGLRQAYLQEQVPESGDQGCRLSRHRMGTWIRGGLSCHRTRRIDDHVAHCTDCQTVVTRLAESNGELTPPPRPR